MINLNLLTPADKKRFKIEVALLLVKDALLLILAAATVISTLLVISRVILQKNFEEFVRETRLIESQNPQLQQKVNEINAKTESLSVIQHTWAPVHGYLEEISQVISNSSRLVSFSLNTKENVIFLAGFSPTREEVLAIEKRLENLPFVQEVQSPLTNILKAKDINFSFEVRLLSNTLP